MRGEIRRNERLHETTAMKIICVKIHKWVLLKIHACTNQKSFWINDVNDAQID